MGVAIAGRSQCASRPSTIRLAATMAPVDPADTTASTLPSRWSRMALTIGESGRLRTAVAGDSPMAMSCVHGTTDTGRSAAPPASSSAVPMAPGSP